jgi:hypothetical protein
LAAEVEAVKSYAEYRNFRQMIAACIETTKTQNKLVYLTFPIDVRPFPVFEENVGKIGFLPSDLARQVTQFYSYARASAQDFRTLSDQDLYAWPLPIAVRFLERIKKSIDDNAELAVNLIPKLRQEAERTWKDYLQPV